MTEQNGTKPIFDDAYEGRTFKGPDGVVFRIDDWRFTLSEFTATPYDDEGKAIDDCSIVGDRDYFVRALKSGLLVEVFNV